VGGAPLARAPLRARAAVAGDRPRDPPALIDAALGAARLDHALEHAK